MNRILFIDYIFGPLLGQVIYLVTRVKEEVLAIIRFDPKIKYVVYELINQVLGLV